MPCKESWKVLGKPALSGQISENLEMLFFVGSGA